MENLIAISNKYIEKIQALTTMSQKDIHIEESSTSDYSDSLIDIFESIYHYKIKKFNIENDPKLVLDEADSLFMMKIEETIRTNVIAKHLAENLEVFQEDEKIFLKTNSALADTLHNKLQKILGYLKTENELYNNSIIMSLTNAFELLVSDLLKDYVSSDIRPNFMHGHKVDFKDIDRIGSIESVKEFMIDNYTESVLRQGAIKWFEELHKFSSKINVNDLENHKELLIETFQRRHLLVHNNGIVNDHYLSKVDSTIIEGIKNGQKLLSNKDYLSSRLNIFREIGLLLIYKYFSTIYRSDKMSIYFMLNEHILERIHTNCKGTRQIYKLIMDDNDFTEEMKSIARINYWLSKKFNGTFEEIQDEVRAFTFHEQNPQYLFAQKLLLDEFDEAIKLLELFTKGVRIDSLVIVLDWPIMNLLGNNPKFLDIKSKAWQQLSVKEESAI